MYDIVKNRQSLQQRTDHVAALGTDHVRIVCAQGEVRIEPVNDVAGSLARYGKNKIAFRVARDRAWGAVVREKHKRR